MFQLELVLYGALIIVFLIFEPRGLFGLWLRITQLLEGLAILLLARYPTQQGGTTHHASQHGADGRPQRRPWYWRPASPAAAGPTPTAPTEDGAIKTDFGVTKEPCPKAIDTTKGCIYLGTISDLTVGPFAPLAVPITKAQIAFWKRVNKAGGIGGVRDRRREVRQGQQVQPADPQRGLPGDQAATSWPWPRRSARRRPRPSLRTSRRAASSPPRRRGRRCGTSRTSSSSPGRTTASSR